MKTRMYIIILWILFTLFALKPLIINGNEVIMVDFSRIQHRDLTTEQKNNMAKVYEKIVIPLFNELKVKLVITSWVREPSQNAFIGGAKHSDHLTGLAIDIFAPELSKRALYKAIKKLDLPIRQVILYKHRRHIHISINSKGKKYKKEYLIYDEEYYIRDKNIHKSIDK